MVQRIQPYILLLSLVIALWLLFYSRFVRKVNFMSLLMNSTLAVIRPLSDHPGFNDVVVAYIGWGGGGWGHLRDIEPQQVSSKKNLGHILIFGRELFHAILKLQVA